MGGVRRGGENKISRFDWSHIQENIHSFKKKKTIILYIGANSICGAEQDLGLLCRKFIPPPHPDITKKFVSDGSDITDNHQ